MSNVSLASARRNFYAGNYSDCIISAKKIEKSDKTHYLESQILLYRSLILMGSIKPVIRELERSEISEIQCINLFAKYLLKDQDSSEIINQITNLSKSCREIPEISYILKAYIFIQENQFNEALKILSPIENLECLSITAIILSKMNQHELACKKVEYMKKLDEDHIIVQMTTIVVYLHAHVHIKEVSKIIRELLTIIPNSPILLSLRAAYYANKMKWVKMEEILKKLSVIDPLNQNTMFNYLVPLKFQHCSNHSFMESMANAINHDPSHPLSIEYENMSQLFDSLCQ